MASLPCSQGGFGLHSAVEHAPAAYFSSLSQLAPLVSAILGRDLGTFPHLATTVHLLASAADKQHWKNATNIDIPHRYRLLSNIIDKAVYNLLVESAPDMRSKTLALTGAWLQAVPFKPLELHLQDREFRICLQYWLGIKVAGEPFQCPSCRGAADAWGNHQVGCGGNSDRIQRQPHP